MNYNETETLLAAISDIWKNSRYSEAAAATWADILKDVSFKKANSALLEFAKSSSFAPTPNDILKLCENKPAKQELTPQQKDGYISAFENGWCKRNPQSCPGISYEELTGYIIRSEQNINGRRF